MRTFQEYVAWVVNEIAASGLTNDWAKIRQIQSSRTTGAIRAFNLNLTNGALFGFTEDVEIADGKPQRPSYSYQYEHNGLKFHYDKDSDPNHIVKFSHEACHLHVVTETPRYITHETDLDQMLNFIRACFFEN